MGITGQAVICMDMLMSAHYDMVVWGCCKDNNLITVAIPKCLCDSIRMLNIGPMAKYSSMMLFIMQTR